MKLNYDNVTKREYYCLTMVSVQYHANTNCFKHFEINDDQQLRVKQDYNSLARTTYTKSKGAISKTSTKKLKTTKCKDLIVAARKICSA